MKPNPPLWRLETTRTLGGGLPPKPTHPFWWLLQPTERTLNGGSGGDDDVEVVVTRWGVAASGLGDRIDRVTRSIFEVGQKSPPEKFSGGDDGAGAAVVVAAGKWGEKMVYIKDYRNEKIDIRFRRECESMIDELKGKFNGMSIEINKKKELQQLEQAAELSTYTTEPSQRFKSICYDDDDDYDYEESTIPLNKFISQIPPSIAITPVLPTLEPEDSLIIGDEHLSTIPEKKSDEVIKSSVENLVPIPSESEDTTESDSDCDLPSCDDFSPINVSEEKSMTFSNPLFVSNDDFTSSDDDDINPLFDEVLENIESKDSYVSNLDEPDLLVTPLSAFNEDECFDPGGDIVEINVFLDIVVSTDIEDDYYDSEG
ncbi:hypothetical protein Tco_1155565 [Tanacetum coccineum]